MQRLLNAKEKRSSVFPQPTKDNFLVLNLMRRCVCVSVWTGKCRSAQNRNSEAWWHVGDSALEG